MSTKINLKKILLIGILSTFNFNFAYAENCAIDWIAEIFTSIEKNENKKELNPNFSKDLIDEIKKQNIEYDWKTIEESEIIFRNKQNEKYRLAIEYLAVNIMKKPWSDLDKWKLNELADKDFFIYYKKNDIISEKKRVIPWSLLFKSGNLDSIIYSCVLLKNQGNINYSTWKWIEKVINEIQWNVNKSQELIIKQREANIEAMHKYSAFIENYKIHKRLESIIKYLEKLQTRFRDLAHLVSIMPAKLVNFWFTK